MTSFILDLFLLMTTLMQRIFPVRFYYLVTGVVSGPGLIYQNKNIVSLKFSKLILAHSSGQCRRSIRKIMVSQLYADQFASEKNKFFIEILSIELLDQEAFDRRASLPEVFEIERENGIKITHTSLKSDNISLA